MVDRGLISVKQFAELNGVSKQAVYKKMKNGPLAQYVVEVEGQKYLMRDALGDQGIEEPAQANQDEQPERPREEPGQQNGTQPGQDMAAMFEAFTEMIETLREQLATKDRQIQELNARLEQALTLTGQSHILTAQAQQLQSGGDPVKLEGEPVKERTQEPEGNAELETKIPTENGLLSKKKGLFAKWLERHTFFG